MENNIQGVYALKVGDSWYIGSSTNVEKRFYHHTNLLKNNKHHNKELQKFYNIDCDLEFIILEKVEHKVDLLPRENYFILKYKHPISNITNYVVTEKYNSDINFSYDKYNELYGKRKFLYFYLIELISNELSVSMNELAKVLEVGYQTLKLWIDGTPLPNDTSEDKILIAYYKVFGGHNELMPTCENCEYKDGKFCSTNDFMKEWYNERNLEYKCWSHTPNKDNQAKIDKLYKECVK